MTRHVVWDRGVGLAGHGLWLDPLTVRAHAFVSHAHSDHSRRHHQALLTAETLELLPEPRRPRSALVAGYREPVPLGQATGTLYPAGHMLGSAQLLFEHEGSRLLYTGDIKLLRGWDRPETFIPAADVLVMESTYGRPHFRFPDQAAVVEAIALWCRRALDSRASPVLLCQALGKAQDLMLMLAPYGFQFALEERCLPAARAYEAAGVRLPDWVPLNGEADGRVVMAPPAGKEAIRRLPRYRTALVSGWACDPDFRRLFGADLHFPLSDHCDFDELLQLVARSGAQQVYTVHGFAEDFARHLRKRGLRAWALWSDEQLTLF